MVDPYVKSLLSPKVVTNNPTVSEDAGNPVGDITVSEVNKVTLLIENFHSMPCQSE